MSDEPKWMMFECGGGARYTSTTEDDHGKPCTFSGCNCNNIVRKVGTTTDRNKAAAWFRRPPIKAYRVIGWYPNIQPRDRKVSTLSDGAIFSTRQLADEHIAKYSIHVLRVDEIKTPGDNPEIDHLLRL
jgi:hypothetical protein